MKKEITIVRTFDAPREKVWEAWIDAKELAKWWGPKGVTNPECEVDPRIGGTIYVVMLAGKELGPMAGQRWPMRGTFVELSPPERLVFENNAVDGAGNILLSGLTTVVLEDSGGLPGKGKTKMTLTTSAEGTAPGTDQMIAGMQMGWEQSLDKLGELLLW